MAHADRPVLRRAPARPPARREETVTAGRSTWTNCSAELDRTGTGTGSPAVLQVASFLVDGIAWHDRQTPPAGRGHVDVLPPFAGG